MSNPLRVTHDPSRDEIVVNGVTISGQVFRRVFCEPSKHRLFRFCYSAERGSWCIEEIMYDDKTGLIYATSNRHEG